MRKYTWGLSGAGNQLQTATGLVVADLLQRLFLLDLNAILDEICRQQRSMAHRRSTIQRDGQAAAGAYLTPQRSITLTANPLGMPGARCAVPCGTWDQLGHCLAWAMKVCQC